MTSKKRKITVAALKIGALCTVSLILSGCFTGVESTPKIKASEVRHLVPATKTAEEMYLADIKPQAPKDWVSGKKFYITDSKISFIFSPTPSDSLLSEGHELEFAGIRPSPSVTGKGASALYFLNERGDTLRYKMEIPVENLLERDRMKIPFTIEYSVIDSVSRRLVGKEFYINTPEWLPGSLILEKDENVPSPSRYVKGLRHTKVRITKVEPGNDAYPASIYFKDTTGELAPDREYKIYLTVASEYIATRNFESMFSIDDPRKQYPQITDRIWNLIIHSRVEEGMTRDECRLALGTPAQHRSALYTHAAVERWNYDNGVYLIFEDGYLSSFRL